MVILFKQKEVLSRAEALTPQLIKWRRNLHMNPELSFQEVRTSRFVTDILNDIHGMKVQTAVGFSTAVVGTLSNGPGHVIALRADIYAIPTDELHNIAYRSLLNSMWPSIVL